MAVNRGENYISRQASSKVKIDSNEYQINPKTHWEKKKITISHQNELDW